MKDFSQKMLCVLSVSLLAAGILALITATARNLTGRNTRSEDAGRLQSYVCTRSVQVYVDDRTGVQYLKYNGHAALLVNDHGDVCTGSAITRDRFEVTDDVITDTQTGCQYAVIGSSLQLLYNSDGKPYKK